MLSYVPDEGRTASTTLMEVWFHSDKKTNRHTVRDLVPCTTINNETPFSETIP